MGKTSEAGRIAITGDWRSEEKRGLLEKLRED
jgi:hypothetical protein